MERSAPGSPAFACAPSTLAEATQVFAQGLDLNQPTLALVVGAGDVEEVRGPLMAALDQRLGERVEPSMLVPQPSPQPSVQTGATRPEELQR